MGYVEHAAPGLACVWTRTGGGSTRVLPDACVDVIWRKGEGAFVAGPDTTAQLSTGTADEVLVGARFATGTGAPVLGIPFHALRDQRVPLADLRPDLVETLPPDLDLARVLRRLSRITAPADPLVDAAVEALADPRRRTADLAADLGLSDRQLRRRLDAAVGYGPKVLQRVLRLQRFIARAERAPQTDLARHAADTGYADQAHLAHDCVRLTGLPPSELLRERAAPQPSIARQTQ